MRHVLTAILLCLPSLSFAQIYLPHPVQLITSFFATEIAACEAAQPMFKGKTAKFLRAAHRIAPELLEPEEVDATAEKFVSTATKKDLSKATERTCNQRIFPRAKRALDALPCYRDQDARKCPELDIEQN